MSSKSFKASPEALPDGGFRALVSPFGGPPDLQGDVIDERAYDTDVIYWAAQAGVRALPLLVSHDWNEPEANIGRITKLEVVPGYGLVVEGLLDVQENPKAALVHRLLKERRLVEFSIGYEILGSRKQSDGSTLLTDLHLIEISVVLKGAAATDGVRGGERTELLAVKGVPSIETDPLRADDLVSRVEEAFSGDMRADLERKFDPALVAAVYGDDPASRAAAAREAERKAALARFEAVNRDLQIAGTLPSERERDQRIADQVAREQAERAARSADHGGQLWHGDRQ